MKFVVCAVRDSAMDGFAQPFMAPTAGIAVRGFRDECNRADPNNQLHKHPSDFELFQIAVWDDSTARYEQLQDFQLLARGKDMAEGVSGS